MSAPTPRIFAEVGLTLGGTGIGDREGCITPLSGAVQFWCHGVPQSGIARPSRVKFLPLPRSSRADGSELQSPAL